jgi:histidinol dehydrogenase
MRIFTDIAEAKTTVLRRAPLEEVSVPKSLAEGIKKIFGSDLTPNEAVSLILADIRKRGDDALRDWTMKIDGTELRHIEVPKEAWTKALDATSRPLVEALETAAEQISAFHAKHVPKSWIDFSPQGGTLGQIITPLQRVGIYAPGGRAAYPSSILMQVVPAKVAGVNEVIVTSPPGKDGLPAAITLAACAIAKADRVFALGGAQAIGSLAYGTASVPRVDKIMGPGNIFVSLAKRQVYGTVSIDQVAGPTETIVIADDSAKPDAIAMDLLAQAEHDPLASAILLTTSKQLADAVVKAIEIQCATLRTGKTAAESLARNGGIVIVDRVETAVELANEYAPEHLCLETNNPWSLVPLVKNAGGIFVGEDSPEVMGDYVAGPSHVMPTSGTARFFSPLNSTDFVKISSLVALSRQELTQLGPVAAAIADAEGLNAHAEAIRVRLDEETSMGQSGGHHGTKKS